MGSNKKEYNSYERELLLTLKVIKILLVVYILFNLFLPTYSGGVMGFHKLYSIISIIFMCIGVYCAHGHLNQYVPLFPEIVLRVVQIIMNTLLSKSIQINLISYGLLLLVDAGFYMYIMLDKDSIDYIIEREVDM